MKEMFTVLRARCYRMIAILFCCIPFTMEAQVVALSKLYDTHRTTTATQNERSLLKVLNDLQDHYNISLVYEYEVVSGKLVKKLVEYGPEFETTISEVLEPLGLKIKKINDRTYAISPEKAEKPSENTSSHSNSSSAEKEENSAVSPESKNVLPELPASTWVVPVLTVSGIVTDENNHPLPGVNVLVKGTTMGTTTDVDGRYTLEVPDGESILTFTFIGYTSVDVRIDNRTEINISLDPDVRYLDEVMVIGYGTVKKSDLTGSVAQIKSEEINAFPTSNILQALSGRAAGVHVIQGTGAPGGSISVRIRGTNSIRGENEPLYVIDGFPFSGSPTQLNNSDIESIEVLKDASATAIYGSRGANGVVMITTKQGRAGQTKVDFETSYSVQTLRKKLDLMNGREYAQLINIQAVNENREPYFTQEEVEDFGEGFDWQDLIFQEAPMQNSSLTVSGGNEKTTFSVGGSIFQQEGIIKGSDYNRYSLRTNFNHEISKKFSLSLSSSMANLITDRRDSGGGARGNSMIGAAISAAPISTPYNDDGTYRVLANEYPFIGPDIRNPLNYINEQFRTVDANVILVEEPKTVAAELFYNTAEEVEVAVNAIYSPWRTNTQAVYSGVLDIHTDYGYGRGSYAQYNAFQGMNANNINRTAGFWNFMYLSIRNANLVIANAPNGADISQEDINGNVGEAKFMRAFTYFHLVRNWGGVPLRTEETMVEKDLARSSEAEVYDLILADLADAEINLPDDPKHLGRPNKLAAKTLLADVYLTLGRFAEARDKSNEVMQSNQYSLVPVTISEDFQDIFGPAVNTTPEEIFYFKYARIDGQGNYLPWILNHPSTDKFAFGGAYAHYGDSADPFYTTWNDDDLRKEMWDIVNFGLGATTMVSSKFIDPSAPTASDAGNDSPQYRYAEVLLIYAEAATRAAGGPTPEAVEALNKVHRRAYGYDPNTPSPVDFNIGDYDEESFVDLVLQERGYEFIFEGKRWFDLKRTGTADEVLLANRGITIAPSHYLWPIPVGELNFNKALDPATDQNPGY